MYVCIGDPISFGQKKKLFKIRPKCENHEKCQQLVNGVYRSRPSINRGREEEEEVIYEYDTKFHYHGPIEKHIVTNATTIVFFHGNGIPACEFNFFAQEVVKDARSPINVVFFGKLLLAPICNLDFCIISYYI